MKSKIGEGITRLDWDRGRNMERETDIMLGSDQIHTVKSFFSSKIIYHIFHHITSY